MFFETFGSHKTLTRAGMTAKDTSPEIRELWSAFMQKWISFSALGIDAERDRGAAPRTLPARVGHRRSTLMNERTLSASFAAEQPSVPEANVLDTLVHIWITSIYGEAP